VSVERNGRLLSNEQLVQGFQYAYKDHLGSILSLTDYQGVIVGEQSGACPEHGRRDAFGRYRDPDTWQVYNSTPSEGGVFDPNVIDMPEWFNRGYTGHEHLREFDLINMNGRFYDPIPGRMLSADNYVQEPGNSQSYNRYSYAFNNPLKYTDPSGEFNVWAALGAAAAAAGISYLGNVVNNNFEWNPNNWSSGAVTVGLASNGSTIDLFGGGSIAGNSFIAGRNISTGIWGGGSSSFGQASYSQMPSYSLGKINMGIVNSYIPQFTPAGLPEYNGAAESARMFVSNFNFMQEHRFSLAYGGGGGGPGDGFGSGLADGFGAGLASTANFVRSLGTAQGWRDLGQGVATMATLSCATCPEGVMMRTNMAIGSYSFAKNVPNMSAYEFGYGLGFGSEKMLEFAVTRGVYSGAGVGFRNIRFLSNSTFRGTTLFKTGKNFRIDLDFRNGLHYHRRGPGGIGRHRPWQIKPGDNGDFWKRF